MLTLAIIKMSAFVPIMAVLALVIRKVNRAEEDLLLRQISWQEYESLKQSAMLFSGLIFTIGMIVCLL